MAQDKMSEARVFPEGWLYMEAISISETSPSIRKMFSTQDDSSTEVIIHGVSDAQMIEQANLCDEFFDAIGKSAVYISSIALERVLQENNRSADKITELQAHSTLREEQLRAYRRMKVSPQQLASLQQDLIQTTNRVLKGYSLEPLHEIPLPQLEENLG